MSAKALGSHLMANSSVPVDLCHGDSLNDLGLPSIEKEQRGATVPADDVFCPKNALTQSSKTKKPLKCSTISGA